MPFSVPLTRRVCPLARDSLRAICPFALGVLLRCGSHPPYQSRDSKMRVLFYSSSQRLDCSGRSSFFLSLATGPCCSPASKGSFDELDGVSSTGCCTAMLLLVWAVVLTISSGLPASGRTCGADLLLLRSVLICFGSWRLGSCSARPELFELPLAARIRSSTTRFTFSVRLSGGSLP